MRMSPGVSRFFSRERNFVKGHWGRGWCERWNGERAEARWWEQKGGRDKEWARRRISEMHGECNVAHVDTRNAGLKGLIMQAR